MPSRAVNIGGSASGVHVEFCGSLCWRKGVRTFCALARREGEVPDDDVPLKVIVDGQEVTVRNIGACMNACESDPAARLVVNGKYADAVYFTADSMDAVDAAVRNTRGGEQPKPPAE